MNQTMLRVNYSNVAKQKLSEEEKQFYLNWDENVATYQKQYSKVYCNGDNELKKVALTFDDAPDSYCTPKILQLLEKHNVRASFSVVGLHIEENQALLKRIYNENHTIINHTYKHYDLTTLTRDNLISEINQTENLIYKLI